MNRPLIALFSRLTYGKQAQVQKDDSSGGFVETLAGVYEKARNALEYRAENLVRRAAIERILKRRIVINKNSDSLSRHLITELRWAKYISHEEVKLAKKMDLPRILSKYTVHIHGNVPQEWVIKAASAEVEELFNLNTDYKQFTFFTFQAIRQKIKLTDENTELLVFFATDKTYAGSDDEQIFYHILKLAGENITAEKLENAWKLFNLAKNHKDTPRIVKYVRRQMSPLILLRDLYFYHPSEFKKNVSESNLFLQVSSEVLDQQLTQLSGRINRAGIRSVIYVFLTKMILAFGMEIPFDIFLYGKLNKLPLILNLIFPPLIMWFTTIQVRVPSRKERLALIERGWHILHNFEDLTNEEDNLTDSPKHTNVSLGYIVYSILYWIFFIGVFAGIFYVLGRLGYTLFNKLVFVFFLTVIAFFAYRISQIVKIYSWKDIGREKTTLLDLVSVPILAIGSRISQGLSKLNFLAFAFDFILEAPFKIILGFVDDWVQFLSVKKEEQILE